MIFRISYKAVCQEIQFKYILSRNHVVFSFLTVCSQEKLRKFILAVKTLGVLVIIREFLSMRCCMLTNFEKDFLTDTMEKLVTKFWTFYPDCLGSGSL